MTNPMPIEPKHRRLHLILGMPTCVSTRPPQGRHHPGWCSRCCNAAQVPELELEQPVAAIKQLSRDPDFKAVVRLKDGRTLSVLAIQEGILACAASRACAAVIQMQIGSCVNGRRLSACWRRIVRNWSGKAGLGDQAVVAGDLHARRTADLGGPMARQLGLGIS